MLKPTKPTRRCMLRAAIAAGVAPLVLPRHVLAGSGGTLPSERINLAIIGLKKMGGTHVTTLLGNESIRIAAICDVDSKVRETTRQKIEAAYAARSKNGTPSGC